jgi:two-component system, cell cycle sensor histidine kinase and response regulator CckA
VKESTMKEFLKSRPGKQPSTEEEKGPDPAVPPDPESARKAGAGSEGGGPAAGTLHESERKYRELVENANSIIMRRDPRGTITFFNEFAQTFFGYEEKEILGKNVFGTIVPERDSQGRDLKNMIEDIGRNPERYATNENENMRRNGERVWIAWTNKAIRDREGNVKEVLCVGNDITERKRLAEQLLLSRKMEAVGRLAEGIAHDFNNILTAIIGCSELMLMNLQEGEYLYRKAEQIKKSGERGAALTRRLLEFSQRRALKPQVQDLNRIVLGQEEMLRRLVGEDIRLRTELVAKAPAVMLDLGAVEQLLIHLALNAREAMPGGGNLVIRTENAVAEEEVPGGPHVVLVVSDTGVGMDEETRTKLFEPFFTTKGIGHGTGLSLATVYEIVKQCGGEIRVKSRPDEGASFRIFFPCALEKSLGSRPFLARKTGVPNRETVLLVEDEREVRTLIHEVLGKNGYTVLEARDSRDALNICERHGGPIHLMVADVVMPDLSGCELARRLEPIRPEMQVLYMSGHARETIERRRGRGIPGEFLEKPFTADELSSMIRKVLDTRGTAEV